MDSPIIKIVIPARNEEDAIGPVVASVVKQVDAVIVADNGSTDSTAKVARDAGAIVVSVPEAGYGRACLAAIQAAGDLDILVFMDGDASDDRAHLWLDRRDAGARPEASIKMRRNTRSLSKTYWRLENQRNLSRCCPSGMVYSRDDFY